jgi:hypothetical protein
MREEADRRVLANRWVDILLVVLGVVGLALFVLLYDRAFPSAALDLKLSRAEIVARARDYMRGQGYDLGGYQFALTFGQEWTSSVYLQTTLGIPQTNDLVREKHLPLWLWQARWFRPLQKEELYLSLMPDGTVVALTHSILEDAPGADISQEDARAVAEAFLVQDREWDLRDWELISSSTETQPGGRSDHYFAWKRADWDIGSSELRLAVSIQGDTVGGYGYWIKVPETFLRRFSEQRNRAGFISGISYYLGVGGFGVAALFLYVLGHRRGILPWQAGLGAGLAVASVELLDALNSLLLHKAWYGTTQDYAAFWIDQLLGIALAAVSTAGMVIVLWTGGRYLARKVWQQQDKVLARGQDRWISLAGSAWRGLMLGGINAGYVVVFYLIATQFLGGWVPMGGPSFDLYATPLPFLSPLAAGVSPAITEEFLFRLIGIGLIWAAFKKRWIAWLVPGVLWAFAHLSYVRDPIYLRGIELTLVAVLMGVSFWRFDLTTTIVAHLAFNVLVTAMPLLRAQEPYFVVNGVVVVAGLWLPVLPGAVRWTRRRIRGMTVQPDPVIRPAGSQDVAGLLALEVPGADWVAWMDDPATPVICLSTPDGVIGAAAGRVGRDGRGEVIALCRGGGDTGAAALPTPWTSR